MQSRNKSIPIGADSYSKNSLLVGNTFSVAEQVPKNGNDEKSRVSMIVDRRVNVGCMEFNDDSNNEGAFGK